jgi:lipopolysaccharide export system permease protein
LIITRYLLREIAAPLAPVLGILVMLFASYSAAGFLSDAVNGLLPTSFIAQLVGLKLLIALEVLIPISLYIAVILAFDRLHRDSEFAAMFALSMQPEKVWGIVLTMCVTLAAVVGLLSLYVRPWAYHRLHVLSDHAEITLHTDSMEPGTFYVGQHGRRVIFFLHRAGSGAPAQDVFMQIWHDDYTQIISARLASPLPKSLQDGSSRVRLLDAHVYDIGRDGRTADQVLDAGGMLLNLHSQPDAPTGDSAVAIPSADLWGSTIPADIAELQWRLSTPLSTIILGMLGIPMSRRRPRQNRYAKFGVAIVIYFAYYLLCTSARTWVQHGEVSSLPGIWWVPGFLALFLLVMLRGPYLPLGLWRRRA